MMRRVKCPEMKVNEFTAANYYIYLNKARIFLLVDLREFFFKSMVGGTKKK